jgi:hypothetical protein
MLLPLVLLVVSKAFNPVLVVGVMHPPAVDPAGGAWLLQV